MQRVRISVLNIDQECPSVMKKGTLEKGLSGNQLWVETGEKLPPGQKARKSGRLVTYNPGKIGRLWP